MSAKSSVRGSVVVGLPIPAKQHVEPSPNPNGHLSMVTAVIHKFGNP